MSIASQAIITTARKLITGATWAGTNVEESPIDPVDGLVNKAAEGEVLPYIAVYIERMTAKDDGGAGDADLKVYIYLPPNRVKMPDGEAFSPSRKNSGMTLNIITRQVENALAKTVEPWSEIWRKLVLSIGDRTYRQILIEHESGVRVPAVELSLALTVLREPEIGSPLSQTYQLLDAALRANGDEAVADVFKAAIENPADLESYQDAAMQLHMTSAAIEGLGIGPVTPDAVDEEGAIPVLADTDLIDPEPEDE
jgi:hypothetical protein